MVAVTSSRNFPVLRGRSSRPRGSPAAFAAALLAAASLAVASLAAATSPAAAGARRVPEDPFRPSALVATVRTLADTAWTGRGPGTPGLDSAAAYLARRFAEAGLAPGGDAGGWLQRFELQTGVEIRPGNRLESRRGGPWTLERDFLPLGFSASGQIAAPLVFAG